MNQHSHRARLYTIGLFFVLLLVILIWRVTDLTVLNQQFLKGQGDARSLRVIDIPAYRGMITDRHGAPLAVSSPVQSLWINPKLFDPEAQQIQQLEKLLRLKPNTLANQVKHHAKREFVYIRRHLSPSVARQIAELKIKGVNFQQEFKRYYPEVESTAQLLGFTNVDDMGIEGLELAFQDWLMGVSGKKRVLKDRSGHVIEDLGVLKEPRPGNDLVLSIDRRIQYLAYNELKKTVKNFEAKSGSVVVLDARSGEILAVANAPSFNPNVRGRYARDNYRNRAFTDLFEPGSVIKPFSIASALQSGLFKADSVIDTNPSWMRVNGKTIRDLHNYGVLDVTGILQHSSNIGVTKMVLQSPPEQLLGILHRSGFGTRTESGYPGESDGFMVRARDASPFVLATVGFGYGLSVTALQLAKGYLVFANHGKALPVSLLHNETQDAGTQVVDEKVAHDVLRMMEAVLGKEGTGKNARVKGYRVAGKTGTARIAIKSGYAANRHIGSFAGIAPVSNPRLVVAVVIHEPRKISYYGSQVAAPLFAKIMAGALRIMDIPPDENTV